MGQRAETHRFGHLDTALHQAADIGDHFLAIGIESIDIETVEVFFRFIVNPGDAVGIGFDRNFRLIFRLAPAGANKGLRGCRFIPASDDQETQKRKKK